MFNLRSINTSYDKGRTYVGGTLYKVLWIDEDRNEIYVCLLNTWTMGSCAARSLYQFDSYFRWTEERKEEFFTFLDCEDFNHYNSRNIYMFLSDFQTNTYLEPLVEGLEVIDTFDNKGNGGDSTMSLYRWVSPRIDDLEEEEEEDE